MAVERRTAGAGMDSLSADDYAEIYRELRGYDEATGEFALSLRKFSQLIDSELSHAVWSKYDHGRMDLSRRMQNELRRAVGMEALPPTVEEAIFDVDPNAEVLAVDVEGRDIDLVLLANKEYGLRSLRKPSAPKRRRKKMVRPVASPAQDELRERLGVSWKDVIEAGLSALDSENP